MRQTSHGVDARRAAKASVTERAPCVTILRTVSADGQFRYQRIPRPHTANAAPG
jgi:hypothetical protein